MITSLLLITLIFGLAIGYVIGLFNKKIGARMTTISHLLWNLKPSSRNLKGGPRKLRQLLAGIICRRRLLWRLLSRNKQRPRS